MRKTWRETSGAGALSARRVRKPVVGWLSGVQTSRERKVPRKGRPREMEAETETMRQKTSDIEGEALGLRGNSLKAMVCRMVR